MYSTSFVKNNFPDQMDAILNNNKPSKLEIKLENMKQVIHKSTQNQFINHWKNHVPTFGWTSMNYPNSIRPSLVKKYEDKRDKFLQEEEERKIKEKIELEDNSDKKMPKKLYGKKNFRIPPDQVNKEVYEENQGLVDPIINPSEKFLVKKNDNLLYYRNMFKKLEDKKSNFIKDTTVPYNYNLPASIQKKLVNELGYKNSLAILSTNTHEKKQDWIEAKFSYDTKYCTIFPKRIFLGEKPSTEFSKPMKRIGDISFEEEVYEPENVTHLKRWTPDNITNESIKDFLSSEVKILNIENHYWLSQDVISKIGRLAINLVDLNLRNLEILNPSLEMILKNTHK